jgi:hypothetical protein
MLVEDLIQSRVERVRSRLPIAIGDV